MTQENVFNHLNIVSKLFESDIMFILVCPLVFYKSMSFNEYTLECFLHAV